MGPLQRVMIRSPLAVAKGLIDRGFSLAKDASAQHITTW